MLRNSNQDTRPQNAQPRVAPVTPPYDADTAAALEVLGPPIGIFRVFARRPDRAHGLAGWGRYYLSRRCALSLRHRELLILRTTALCGAEYEWGVHVQVFAEQAGLFDEQIRSVTAGQPDDPCWTEPADRAVLRAADALDRDSDLSDADWASLVAGVGEEGAVDALLICGWYHAISYVARATRLAPEPDAPLFAGFGASSRVGRVRLATAGSTGAGPKRRELTMAVAVTLDKALDKAYENKSLEEILDAPVAALAGVSDGDAEKLAAAFGIKTVRDLGSSKYFAVAQALVALGAHSG